MSQSLEKQKLLFNLHISSLIVQSKVLLSLNLLIGVICVQLKHKLYFAILHLPSTYYSKWITIYCWKLVSSTNSLVLPTLQKLLPYKTMISMV